MDSQGNYWFGTMKGVSAYDGKEWHADEGGITIGQPIMKGAIISLKDFFVNDVYEDSMGGMWFGTTGGVGHHDGSEWKSYTVDEGLVDN